MKEPKKPSVAPQEEIDACVQHIETYITGLPAQYQAHRLSMKQAVSKGISVEVLQQRNPGMQLAGKLEALAKLTGDQVAPEGFGVYNYSSVLRHVPSLNVHMQAFDEAIRNGTGLATLHAELENRGLGLVWTSLSDHTINDVLTGPHKSAQLLHVLAHSAYNTDALRAELMEAVGVYFSSPGAQTVFEEYVASHQPTDFLRKAYTAYKSVAANRKKSSERLLQDLLGEDI